MSPADLSRRSFLVGTAAAGLALGYSGVPGLLGADQALAAPLQFSIPASWYSIAPDGIRHGHCGKADMGQHIASTMAQIISEGSAPTGRMCGSSSPQRSEVQRPPCSARRLPAAAGAR